MREKLKKLTALLLSISMVLSLFTSVLPAAYAEGEGGSTPVNGNANYDDIVGTGQPGLYVDFLGDNRIYKPAAGETATVLTSGASGLSAPGTVDQSAETNPGGSRTWKGYKNPRVEGERESDEFGGLYEDNQSKETIFWVGVGIDNMDKFDLFQRNAPDGIYSLELGFYYDSRYIEPYIGSGASYATSTDAEIRQAYQSIITEANLSNYQEYKWDNYSVVSAETGLMPQTDWVTQETLAYTSTGYWPNMDQIMYGETAESANPWRMTYVAIEREGEQANRGFSGERGETRYLLIIPFRLKNYDDQHSNKHLCLRLARNAGMFSIGGGEDGSIPYAAWERTTIRNPGRELKLMANFRGDLDIFGGGRVRDELYSATLYLDNGGGSGNTAQMSVDGDPSTKPAMVIGQSQSDRTITGLPAGTGMRVDITVQTGYKATVSVYPQADRSESVRHYILGPVTTKEATKTYSFVMPAENMQVDVKFDITEDADFYLYLDEDRDGDEDRQGETPVKSPVQGNETVLTAKHPVNDPADPSTTVEIVTVDKDSPDDPDLTLPKNLPGEKITIEAPDTGIKTSLEVEVSLHADYYAEVEIEQVSTGNNIRPNTATAGWFSIGARNVVTVTSSGTLEVEGLPQSDIIVKVKYLLANRVTGILEVWHDKDTTPASGNVAQLRTLGYDDSNKGMPAYSGVVYQDGRGTKDTTDDNHRAVETDPPFRVLERVEAQAAALSGSLGGDGNTPVPWINTADTTNPDPNSMMALLYSATSAADPNLADNIHAYDLRKLTGLTKGDGLRKNSEGDYYADSEMSDFFTCLWEFRTKAADAVADPTTAPVPVNVVDVPDPDDNTKTLFSYYDLTPDQLQVYLLDYESDPNAALRSDADAKAELVNYSWYDPKADNGTRPPSMPKTLSEGYSLVTRPGRQMEVVLEASSVYTMMREIRILDKEDYDQGVETPITTATQDPDYRNVYRFQVPDKDYIVKVIYTEREVRQLDLSVTTNLGAVDPGNETKVTAFTPDTDTNGPAAKSVVKTKYTSGTETVAKNVLVDSTVTVQIKKMAGYRVSATVIDRVNNSTVPTTGSTVLNDLEEGTISFTFSMLSTPSVDDIADIDDRIEILITYTQELKVNNANILLAGATPATTAFWKGTNNRTVYPYAEGTALTAEIDVEPGYYIVAAEAYTGANAYPFSLSGNGWNNGAGGRVTLDTFMPDEEYYVRITFAKGPPPEEDRMALALQVMDPDNVGSGDPPVYVDNYATAQAGTVTLGPVGLVRTGKFITNNAGIAPIPGSADPVTEMVKAGELVEVEYVVQDGFALESIVVEPAALGVTPVYVTGADNKVRAQFIMPSASARVIVTFRKTENITEKLFLRLNKTENGVLATETNHGVDGNKVTWVKSDTFDKNSALGSDRKYTIPGGIPATVPQIGAIGTGVANPGEKVSFDVQVASGWYIHSLTLTDALGSRMSYSLDTVGGEQVVSFTMPASDVTAIVNYRQGTPPDPDDPKDTDSDRLLELVVLDPDNVGSGDPLVYVDNWAKAEVTGVTTATLGELGLARSATRDGKYVKAGDRVELRYQARSGYTLEVITVTSDDAPSTIAPIYTEPMSATAPGKAYFIMPDANVTAVVRFRAVTDTKPVHEYTANLVLHMPADVDPKDYDEVGEGTFGNDLLNKYYSLTALPGETIDFTAWAKDGYYIQRVSVTPAALGVSATISGAFGLQDGSFVMPAADVQVNVFFVRLDKEKEWPKEVPYTLTLEVYDATGKGGTANFGNIAGTALPTPDSDPVGSGETKTLTDYDGGKLIHELDRVTVALAPADGTYVRSITVTDSRGRNVPWNYVPGGIAFDMPPAHVKVTVHYAQRDDDIDKDRKHNVTLYIRNPKDNDYASLDTDTQHTHTNGDTLIDLFAGDVVTLTATPDPAADPKHSVVSAYVVMVDSSGGAPVVIPTTGLLPSTATTQTGMPLVPTGGQVQFAMPDADAEVYVTFIDGGIPKQGEYTGSLMVVGPTGSGSAVMTATEGSKPTTGNVAASGGGALFAPEGAELTVDLTVNDGFAISSIRVVDNTGNNVPYTWTDGTQRQFKLKMPPNGVQVYVELERVDENKELTVQVVVNNGGGAGNTAKLRLESTDEGDGEAILSPVYAGNQIYLDMTVQVGYRISSIQVVPAKFGIAPTLEKRNTVDQTTSFTMPGEDLVVYVHFVTDGRKRLTANLLTDGLKDEHYSSKNRAMIHSDYTGNSPWVSPDPSTDTEGKDRTSVQAAPATATDPAEWVTVQYQWDPEDAVEWIAVLDATVIYDPKDPNPPVSNVPFTQNEDLSTYSGEITFPMVDSDVQVIIHYKDDPKPVGYEAVLHVIDMDNNTEITDHSWGKLTWTTETTGQITPGTVGINTNLAGVESIKVPAGQKVEVEVDTTYPECNGGDGVYIWAGYVIYRQGGQMINFNFKPDDPGPGFSGHKEKTEFVMHPGVNDVYIYFTKTLKPNDNDFSAVLMIDSPEADKSSSATMRSDGDSPGAKTTTVVANTAPDHGYIISSKGDEITVVVNPAPGFAIDSVLMTPLGVSDDNGDPIVPVRSGGGRYTFKMPGQNVAILVKLRESSAGEYTATLHYASADPGDTTFTKEIARAIMYYDDGSTDVDGDWLKVSEGTKMGLDACINDVDTHYLVLAAYVLQPDGKIVFLDPPLEGTTDVVAGKDNPDGEASFSMPASDVDVYVWFTQEKPTDKEWHTAVLTVTDTKGTTVNSGLNSARFWSSENNQDKAPTDSDYKELPHFVQSYGVKKVDGTNAHGFFWVEKDETVTVMTNPPASGYIFSPRATITHSVSATSGVTNGLAETIDSSGNYIYTYTVGPYNSAVHAHFVSSDIVQNMLDVRIIDRDNPGNGSVTNVVNVAPGTMTALKVESTTSAGAWQRVPNVREGTTISFTVTPDQIPGSATGERYVAVARWINDTTKVSTPLTLTPQSDGSYVCTGSFDMPGAPATLEVTFYKAWEVKLSVIHTGAVPTTDRGSVAQMTMTAAETFSATITATEGTPGTATVPNGTKLEASMQTLNANVRVAGVFLKRSGRPDLQLYSTDDTYRHTMSRSDVEILFILVPRTENDPTYIASVSAENKPAAVADPEIHVTSVTDRTEGSGWTEAKYQDTVTVTLDVPYGYKAVLTATDNVTLTKETVDATDETAGITGETVTFSMPAKNAHVTVKYVKTRFTATIVVTGNGSGEAEWKDYLGLIVTDLKEDAELNFRAKPDDGSRIGSIMISYGRYIPGSSSEINDKVTMPADDVVVTVVFTKERTQSYYLDLHVTNPQGGDAILATDNFGTLTSTPAAPKTYGQLKPVEGGTPVTLTVAPGADYTVTVSYYRHDGNNLYYTSYLIDTDNGGVATFDMPSTNTCIYVKFNGPGDEPPPDPDDNEKYLDLHINDTQGGTVLLTATDCGILTSDPFSTPQSYGQLKPVAAGTSVSLAVTPEPGYTVSVSYYVHNGGTPVSATPATIPATGTGGTPATFAMPDQSTCVYVTFKRSDDPSPDDKNLDLHVSGLANGSAWLTTTEDPSGRTISSTPTVPRSVSTLEDVAAGTTVTLTVTPEPGYIVTVSYYVHNSGTPVPTATISASGGIATFEMPDQSTCVYVHFHKPTDPPDPEPDQNEHIAFVVTQGTDNLPDNVAQDIVNRTDLTKTGGAIWRYGETGDNMFVTFTTEPGYTAVVTATRVDTGASVAVAQQGTTLVGTASLNMPGGADVRVLITYTTVEAPATHNLKLYLVGHDNEPANMGELSVGTNAANTIRLNGQSGPASTTAETGDRLNLFAGWAQKYRIRRITITSGGVTTDLNWNEYGQTAASLFFMPDADADVTVYFGASLKATLLVIDADGNDFLLNSAADTTAPSATNVPDTTLEVSRLSTVLNSTTSTHTPLEDLYGDERVTTTVDSGTIPYGTEISSVIATTASGTRNLTESALNSGIYHYDMSTVTRDAEDVEVTVILRKDEEKKFYIATVYKQGHDNQPGNTAEITNTTTTTGLPKGTIWTGAYENDVLQVDVTTAPDYYAVVTAVNLTTGAAVPILQYAIQGTVADPIVTRFLMPAANVDVTVTYSKTPPDNGELYLELIGHKQEKDNWDEIYVMADENTPPDLTVPTPPSPILTAAGNEASDDSNFRKGPKTVEPGKYLWELPDHGDAYYIKSVTFVPTGFSITDTAFISVLATDAADQFRMPLGGGTLMVEFAPGKKSGRPYDPEHSERYNGTTLTPPGDYATGGAGDDNPDLTVAPTLGQQGWILAEAPDSEKNTVVVTVPTLYDNEEPDNVKALTDAGVAPAAEDGTSDTPPTYQFYWWDEDASAYKLLVLGDDYTVTDAVSLDYNATPNANPKGDYPAGEHHYGYRLTLQAVDGSTAPLAKYIESGGEIYVTATRPGNVLPDDTVPWVESDKTQVIIRPENGLRPYDPDRVDDPNYEDHWIRAENRGDYLVVTVPMLNTRKGDKPTSVDGEIHRLQLHLQVDGRDRNNPIVNVTQLLSIVNINGFDHPVNANPLYDPTWAPGSPLNYLNEEIYENEIYYTDPGADGSDPADDIPYTGARFVVVILTDEEIEALGLDAAAETAAKDNAAILREIFDNDGTMNADTTKKHRMYITSDVVKALTDPLPTFKKEDYADFEVPRYYSFTGILESYAPQHIATFSLYPLAAADPANPDPTDPDEYAERPVLIHKQFRDSGTDLWRLDFAMKSSELMGDDRLGVTYKLEIKKAGHINFTWLELTLSPDTLDDPSDPECLTFTVAAYDDAGNLDPTELGVIALIGGDINDDGYARMEDFTVLMSFIGGQRKQNRTKDPTGDPLNPPTDAQLKKWALSAYNPDSPTYWADLNGDGTVGSADVAIWNATRNYNKSFRVYTSDPDYMVSLRTSAAATTMELDLLMEEPEELPPDALLPEEIPPEELPPEEEPLDGEAPPPEGEEPAGEPEPPLEEPPAPDEGDKPTEDENPDMGGQTVENKEPDESERLLEGEGKSPVDPEEPGTEPDPPEPRPAPEEDDDDESPKASNEDDDQVDKNENDLEIGGMEPLI